MGVKHDVRMDALNWRARDLVALCYFGQVIQFATPDAVRRIRCNRAIYNRLTQEAAS